MERRLSVMRAAKLVGVTRAELQARIKCGALASFDGLVQVGELLELYPATRFEEERTLERLDRIKAEALGRNVAGRSLPDPQVLAQRLGVLGHQLTRARQQAKHYADVLAALEGHLRILEKNPNEAQRAVVQDIKLWMQRTLRQGTTATGDADAPSHHTPLDRVPWDRIPLDEGSWLSVMTPQIRLLPGNHEFLVEGSDTVLEAALRAGLSLNYGCSNGNCGECKARIVSGQVREVRPHDHVISELERLQGYTLLCTVAPITDLVIEGGVAHRPEDIPLQTIEGTVRAIEHPGPHVALLKVQTPRTRRLRFLGGQYARLRLDGVTAEVSLPLANCPCDDRNLVFHVVEDRSDPFAVRCFEGLRKGDHVQLEGPFGHFVMAEEIERPLVFLACDTGFAPIKSLIEHVIALDTVDAMDLIWFATGAVGHYQDNLCRSWEDALDGFHYKPVRVNAASTPEAWSAVLSGSLARLEDPVEHDFFIAGPAFFVALALSALERLGVASERVVPQILPPPR